MADTTIYTTSFDTVKLETPTEPRDEAGAVRIRFVEGTSEVRLLVSCKQMDELASLWRHAVESYDHDFPHRKAVHRA
jgi:hypothetical protein